MKFQKTMAFGLAAVMFAAGLAGCKKQGNVETDGKVNISIGNWPDETDPKGQEMLENYRKQMMEKYPDINVIADTYAYDTKGVVFAAAYKDGYLKSVSKETESGVCMLDVTGLDDYTVKVFDWSEFMIPNGPSDVFENVKQ